MTIINSLPIESKKTMNQPWKEGFLEDLKSIEFDQDAIDDFRE